MTSRVFSLVTEKWKLGRWTDKHTQRRLHSVWHNVSKLNKQQWMLLPASFPLAVMLQGVLCIIICSGTVLAAAWNAGMSPRVSRTLPATGNGFPGESRLRMAQDDLLLLPLTVAVGCNVFSTPLMLKVWSAGQYL